MATNLFLLLVKALFASKEDYIILELLKMGMGEFVSELF
jgi:hypothetical protein